MAQWTLSDDHVVFQHLHLWAGGFSPDVLARREQDVLSKLTVKRTAKQVADRARHLRDEAHPARKKYDDAVSNGLFEKPAMGIAEDVSHDVRPKQRGDPPDLGSTDHGGAQSSRNKRPLPEACSMPAHTEWQTPDAWEIFKQTMCIALLTSSDRHLFISGPPGTGKTHVLNMAKKVFQKAGKSIIVAAPTGLAASLIEGCTLHDVGGFGLVDAPLDELLKRVSESGKARLLRSDVLLIDEISQCGCAVFNALDYVAQHVRGKVGTPFGGLRLIVFGDFLQLPPVKDKYAFESNVWTNSVLNVEVLLDRHTSVLNGVPVLPNGIQISQLACLKKDADQVNWKRLQDLAGDVHTFIATDFAHDGDAVDLPPTIAAALGERAATQVDLKLGAQVVCTAKVPSCGLFNGLRGLVVGFASSSYPTVLFENGKEVTVAPFKFTMQLADGREYVRKQIPLQLAWALTVHKAQGMTLSHALINLDGAFAPGHVYVALSRVASLSGLFLDGAWFRSASRRRNAGDALRDLIRVNEVAMHFMSASVAAKAQ